MSDLPPWEPKTLATKKLFKKWVFDRLYERHHMDAPATRATLDKFSKEYDRICALRPEIEALDYNDVKPLRELIQSLLIEKFGSDYPDIKMLIQPPNRGRGKQTPRRGSYSSRSNDAFSVYGAAEEAAKLKNIENAARDVDFIRSLWKNAYGKWKRTSDNGPSAEMLAAEFWNVTLESITNFKKKNNLKD